MELRIHAPLNHTDIEAASAWIRAHDEETLESQIELSQIPAPPFGERRRAERMCDYFSSAGLDGPRLDEVGNVVAGRPGTADLPPFVVSAHLDTVFPGDTDVTVQRDGDVLRGPGIADDARGLAALVALTRSLAASGLRTRAPILFVATVGEEGLGDLRGVKHLFRDGGIARAASGFISLDGAGIDRIVTRALGSRRFRISVDGPGGHSWVDWGDPNPIHELTAIASRLLEIPLSAKPTATLTIARTGGGKSVNAIPQKAWIELDTRCADPTVLDGIDHAVRRIVDQRASLQDGLGFGVDVIGDRPGGATPADAALVRAAVEATRRLGREPILSLSSTDSNVPMSLGIPAVTLGCGGEAGLAHTTEEWFRNVDGPDGIVRALETLILSVGVA